MTQPTNEQLVDAWRAGDQDAFELLWRRNAGLRVRAWRRLGEDFDMDEADSITAAAFLHAARILDERGKFSTIFIWVARSKFGHARTGRRTKKRTGKTSRLAGGRALEVLDYRSGEREHVERLEHVRQTREALLEAMAATLSATEYEALEGFLAERTHGEIADDRGVSRSAVQQAATRGLKRLAECESLRKLAEAL